MPALTKTRSRAKSGTTPIGSPPGSDTNSLDSEGDANPIDPSSPGSDFRDDHTSGETQKEAVVSEQVPAQTNQATRPSVSASVQGSTSGQGQSLGENHGSVALPGTDPYVGLAFAAQVLDDLENLRIANGNRLGHMTRSTEDSDGETRGMGLSLEHPSVVAMLDIVSAMEATEARAIKELERAMKVHPLGPWVKAQTGIGLKQAARLLGSIGDPYVRPRIEYEDGTVEASRPRLVSELWAYTGYSVIGGESQKRRKGQMANWNDDARKRAWLISASCVKQKPGTKWRDLYDTARAKYADSVHPTPCARCGPAGKPAQVGSPLSAGHQHARALRLISKQVLKEMWIESKRLHEVHSDT